MTQWRDPRHAEAGSIEELETVVAPTRVGSTRSGLIPAFVVGALLVGVVAVGVSGRTEAPRDPVPPVAALDASPTPPVLSDPTHTLPPQRGGPRPAPTPGQPEPPSVDALPEVWRADLRFWLVVVSDGQRPVRLELESTDGFYGTISMGGDWGDDIRARLLGSSGTNDATRVANVRVPRLPDGSLDLPLELDSGIINAQALGAGDANARLNDLRYELRLERGRGRGPGLTLLVAEVFPAYTTYNIESSGLGEAHDRALSSAEVQEALTHSARCSRMLDPKIGRSEANLDGCLRFFARQGVTWEVMPGTEEP